MKRQVFVGNHATQKVSAYNFFFRQHVLHGAAGINEDTQRQRLIALRSKVFDGLRLAFFGKLKRIFAEIGSQSACACP